MRVIHTTSWLSDRGGGIPPVIWGLSREMGNAGVDCLVAGLSNNPPETEGQGGRTTILAGKSHGAFGYSRELRRKVSANIRKDSIVHNHGLWMYPGVIARKEAAAAGIPLVISAHGMLDAWALRNSALKKRVAGWLFENRNLRHAACLHALCETEAKSYRDYGLRNPICIIPNAIDLPGQIDHGTTGQRTTGLQDYETTRPHTPDPRPVSSQLSVVGSPSPAVRSRRSVVSSLKSDGRKVLLYLGRIHPKKGLVNLLKAWAKNRKSEIRNQKSEEWVLAIAGWDQGGHELELKCLCDELGIAWGDVRKGGTTGQQDNVTTALRSVVFLGPQFGDAKAACYQNCDAFILPSFSEGLPMVILEAWAYGKPVLMTTQCNLPEGFAAGAAICVEPNAESLAQGLYTLFQSSISDLQSTGSRGRALVAARFNWARCAREMVEVYRWLLGSGTKPSVII